MTELLIDYENLRNLEIFSEIDKDSLMKSLSSCHVRAFKTDDVIIRKNTKNMSLYLILSGHVSIHLDSIDDEPIAIAITGEVIGEISFIDNKPTSGFVIARSETRILLLDKSAVSRSQQLLQAVNKHLLMTLAKRTRGELHLLNRERENLKHQVAGLQMERNVSYQAEEKFTKAFKASPVPMVITQLSDGRIIEVNESFQTTLGYNREELIGQTSVELPLWDDPNIRSEFIRKLQTQGCLRNFEFTFCTKSGENRLGSVSSESLQIDGSKCIISAVEDITDRKRTEQEIIRAKNEAERVNQAGTEFLANLTHEIRTPLNAISGYTQILLHSKELTEPQREKLQYIDSAVDDLSKFVSDSIEVLKNEAHATTIHRMDFDLSELIFGIGNLFDARLKNSGLAWTVRNQCGDFIPVIGDRGKLRQVLINLVSNATKFTEAGSVTLCCKKEGISVYRFEVADTGIGIARADRDAIFKKFRQTEAGRKKGGTGLGLAIAKGHVELMGGKLLVDDNEKGGSRFFFSLHLPPSTKTQVLPRQARTQRVLGLKSNIAISALVIVNDTTSRNVLSFALESIGVNVQEASNSQQALPILRNKIPNIVFIDHPMPVMDSIEAVTIVRDEFDDKRLKWVAVSGSHVLVDLEKYYFDIGFDDFVSKPIRIEQIYECIRKLLGVQFEYEESKHIFGNKKPDYNQPIDFKIPSSIYTGLKSNSTLARPSNVENFLAQLERLSSDGKNLAKLLRFYAKDFNWEGLLAKLEQVPHEKED